MPTLEEGAFSDLLEDDVRCETNTVNRIVVFLTKYLVGADEMKTREQVESVLLSKRNKHSRAA